MKLKGDPKREAGVSPSELAEGTVYRRAVEAVIWGMPAVNYDLMYQAMVRETKGAFNQIAYWSRLPDWKIQTLTPNPDAIYLTPFTNTAEVGPVVLEIPPADEGSITGTVMDVWQCALEDVGPAGVDKGQGSKYLILPPEYTDKVPEGYIPLASDTYEGYALLRSIPKSGSDADVARAVAYGKRIRLYPLIHAANPPATTFVDAVDVVYDSTIPYDLRFFESLSRIVQTQPWLERDKVMIDQLKSIGIEKGNAFSPDARTQAVLNDAAREAHVWLVARYEASFAPYYEGGHWAAARIARTARRAGDVFRQARCLSRRRPRRHVLLRLFHPQASGRRFGLSADHRRQGWQAPRRGHDLSPHGACERSGQAVLVSDGLRPRHPCAHSECPMAEPLVPDTGTAEER